jgi:hypothetical protein
VFTRPPLAATVGGIASAVVACAIMLTPVTDDSGYVVGLWWSRVAPLSYAEHTLAQAPRVILRDAPGPMAYYLDPLSHAWQGLAATPGSTLRFADLWDHGSPAGRVYALLGLYRLKAPGLRSILAQASRDTASVELRRYGCQCQLRVELSALASIDTLERYAALVALPGRWTDW